MPQTRSAAVRSAVFRARSYSPFWGRAFLRARKALAMAGRPEVLPQSGKPVPSSTDAGR